jgi:hypothetical protein
MTAVEAGTPHACAVTSKPGSGQLRLELACAVTSQDRRVGLRSECPDQILRQIRAAQAGEFETLAWQLCT